MAKDASQTLTLSGSSETEIGDDIDDVDRPRKTGSRADLRDMMRLGRRQELSRNFGFVSIVGFSAVAMSTWQTVPWGTAGDGLSNLVWTYLVVFLCWCTVVASMAEIAPTSGGQYHWVSEFAPRRISRILSYVTGWSCILSWQMAFVSIASRPSQDIQGFLILTGSDFEFQNWQGSLVIIAVAAIAVVFNTNIANSLPLVGGAFILLYVCGFFAILIPLWVLSPRTDVEKVFTSFSNRGDVGGIARSLLFGVFSPMYSLMAPDVSIHMAEEIKDSSLVLPRAMMTTTVVNGLLGFVSLITICFTIGDIDAVLSSDISAHIQVFLSATNSPATALGMTMIMEVLSVFSCITALTNPAGLECPTQCILTSFGFCVIVCLINIGSSLAIDTVISVAVSGNICSYLVSTACLRLKRWRNEPIPIHRWSLGRWGGPLNDIAIAFLAFIFVLFFVPNGHDITAKTMDYSVVVWAGMVLFSIAFYYIKGRHVYTSPVTLIRKDI